MSQDELQKKIFDMIKIISDSTYQKEKWLKGSNVEMSTYEETICTLFDDLCFEDYLENFPDKTNDSYMIMVDLKTKLNTFISENENISTQDLLNHQNWKEIQNIAQSAIDK